jgi:hypothetical protein
MNKRYWEERYRKHGAPEAIPFDGGELISYTNWVHISQCNRLERMMKKVSFPLTLEEDTGNSLVLRDASGRRLFERVVETDTTDDDRELMQWVVRKLNDAEEDIVEE